ncbi:hypothetical protein [Prauserella endophytica]|nr:hypothetical protein [Prauserella endophytica]
MASESQAVVNMSISPKSPELSARLSGTGLGTDLVLAEVTGIGDAATG